MKRALFLSLLLSAASGVTTAGMVALPGLGLHIEVESYQARRFAHVIPQAYDFSCGSAAVATLLTYHYEDERTERDVFLRMYEVGDQEQIQQKGFSLLDMKSFLESEGYRADGFRLSLDDLANAAVPAIALIDTNGYSHFVVVKGVIDGAVLIGDPALGGRRVERAEFEAMWNGVLFLIHNRADVARRYFNQSSEWAYQTRYPLPEAISRATLSEFTRSLPVRHGDYK